MQENMRAVSGHLSGFWGNLSGSGGELVEVGGDVSIMCLTGPCRVCHVARQPRQRSGRPRGQKKVTVCPRKVHTTARVQIKAGRCSTKVSRGVIQFSVFGRPEIVCSPLSALPYIGQDE